MVLTFLTLVSWLIQYIYILSIYKEKKFLFYYSHLNVGADLYQNNYINDSLSIQPHASMRTISAALRIVVVWCTIPHTHTNSRKSERMYVFSRPRFSRVQRALSRWLVRASLPNDAALGYASPLGRSLQFFLFFFFNSFRYQVEKLNKFNLINKKPFLNQVSNSMIFHPGLKKKFVVIFFFNLAFYFLSNLTMTNPCRI